MAIKKYPINDYSPRSNDIFFFDTNVWINIYAALSNYNQHKQRLFSGFLKNIQTAGATIVTNSMILSEFINRYFRFSFGQWKSNTGNYEADYKKDYIGSDSYKEAAQEVTVYVNKILSISTTMTDEFNAINLENVLERINHIDFNDSYIIELANMKDYKIVTDDNDFIKHDIHSSTVVHS